MEQKVFFEENRSKFSVNRDSYLEVSLSNKERQLPHDNIDSDFSLYEQYNKERDNCRNYRLIFAMNPVCSNVLFNMKSEVVIGEGTSAITRVYTSGVPKSKYASGAINSTDTIDYQQAIMNTEYSSVDKGGFTYHCGYDIFNNHFLRNDGFVHVAAATGKSNTFNTIKDKIRSSGSVVKEMVGVKYNDTDETERHLYMINSIQSMKTAFSEKCEEKNGWYGFVNVGNIDISNTANSAQTSVNRLFQDKKPCEFIDLYPGRDLYSFVPKWNSFYKRTEKNWDYCITYPSSSDTETFNKVCGGKNQAVRCSVTSGNSVYGVQILRCSSYFKHNLKAGDFISVYYWEDNEEDKDGNNVRSFLKFSKKVRVLSVGDANGAHKDRIFSVKLADIEGVCDSLLTNGFFFKRLSNGVECNYYFRKFKKLSEHEKSDINKIAFGTNIYGDNVAQILFLDDVVTEGIMDNNGRPLSEVYLTVVKRNEGNKIWYGSEQQTIHTAVGAEHIEYSHCFGKVTDGVDFSGIETEPYDYNVHYLNNVDRTNTDTDWKRTLSAWGETLMMSATPKTLSEGKEITIDNDDFFGDVVEFDSTTYTETIIGDVCFRFNTAQRESSSKLFKNIYEDRIQYDDFDFSAFTVQRYYINDTATENRISGTTGTTSLIYGNIMPEGYYYKPHFKIQLRKESETVNAVNGKLVNYGTDISMDENGSGITSLDFDFPSNYGFIKGDYLAFYNTENYQTTWGEINSVSGNHMRVYFSTKYDKIGKDAVEEFTPGSKKRKYWAFWAETSVPTYAKFSMDYMKFVWRSLVPMSELTSDEDLYDMTFSNGRLYIEKNLNLFLRRQDPEGKYGLSKPIWKETKTVRNPMEDMSMAAHEPLDLSETLEPSLSIFDTCY